MRLILILALIGSIGTLAPSHASTEAAATSPGSASTVLVVGDSISAAYGLDISAGWVALAETELQPQFAGVDFINASISGDTTEGALRRLPAALTRFNPDVLVIELGGNDGLRGYSLKKMQQNLETLVSMGQDAGAKVLLLGMRIPSNYGPAYTEKFAETFVSAAETTGAALVPFFLAPIALNSDYFLPDGIHPNAEAQPLLLPAVIEKLSPLLEAVAKNE